TELEKVGFQLGKISDRVTAETATEGAVLAPSRKVAAECLPVLHVLGGEFVGREGMYPRCCRRDHRDGTGGHQGGGGHFAPGCPPLVVAMGTKELFEGVIGPG